VSEIHGEEQQADSYDVTTVGGGAADLTLASRALDRDHLST